MSRNGQTRARVAYCLIARFLERSWKGLGEEVPNQSKERKGMLNLSKMMWAHGVYAEKVTAVRNGTLGLTLPLLSDGGVVVVVPAPSASETSSCSLSQREDPEAHWRRVQP